MHLDLAAPLARIRFDEALAQARAASDAADHAPPSGAADLLLTCFGPFATHARNASATVVERILSRRFPPAPTLPLTDLSCCRLEAAIAPGGQRLRVISLRLPTVWELASAYLLHEVRRVRPALVLMVGVGRPGQEVALETGAHPRAKAQPDATGVLAPGLPKAEKGLLGATTDADPELGPPLLDACDEPLPLPWPASAATGAGVARAAYARVENRYLCNAVSFALAAYLGGAPRALHLFGDGEQHHHRVPPRSDAFGAKGHAFVHLPPEAGDDPGPFADQLARLIAGAGG